MTINWVCNDAFPCIERVTHSLIDSAEKRQDANYCVGVSSDDAFPPYAGKWNPEASASLSLLTRYLWCYCENSFTNPVIISLDCDSLAKYCQFG